MRLRRVYPILDTQALERRGCPVELAAAALLEAGAGILQFRHKGHWSRPVFEQAQQISRLCREYHVPLIVNDRADIAMLLEAGLHVGQDDLPPRDARRLLGPGALIGYSTHNAAQLESAREEPLSYVALGPIFETGSKQKPDPVVGLDQLRAWRSLVELPIVAIGGITRQNACAVLNAGAHSVAVIGDLLPEPCTIEALRERMREWQVLTEPRGDSLRSD